MATFSYTKGYLDGSTLNAAHLTTILDEIETFLNTTKLNSDNLQTDSISSEHIKAGEISAGLLASDCIETQNIKDGSITKVKQAAVPATTNGSDPGVGGIVFSSSSGEWSDDSTTLTAVTNLSCTLTTTGRPIFLGLVSASTGSDESYIYYETGDTYYDNGSDGYFQLVYLRDTTEISDYFGTGTIGYNEHNYTYPVLFEKGGLAVRHPPPFCIDIVTAGTYTYTVKSKGEGGAFADGTQFYNLKLVAFEL